MKKTKNNAKTKTETKAGEPARLAKRPRVGVRTSFISIFVFVLTFVFFTFDFRNIFID